jgi:hypothetical protein
MLSYSRFHGVGAQNSGGVFFFFFSLSLSLGDFGEPVQRSAESSHTRRRIGSMKIAIDSVQRSCEL